jgi:predicted enzyme related to lactoylglutathione lyase
MHHATVVQVEITGKDSDALRRFYGSLFGWPMRETPTPGYRLTAMDRSGISVGIGRSRDGQTPRLTAYVEVEDIREHLSYAEELGGSVISQPFEVHTHRGQFTYALVADPAGNLVGLSSGLERALYPDGVPQQ